ncbi:MAG: DMT family transporter [Chloroflexota bacterium]
MLPPVNFLGVVFALVSAVSWGSGDFTGGVAARRSNPFFVLMLSSLSGIVILLICALLWRESFSSLNSVLWAMAAGVSGAFGMAIFYRALSMGHPAQVAPVAAVIGVMLPVGFGIFTDGLPDIVRLVGFAIAMLGIWLVSQSSSQKEEDRITRLEFILACLAGMGFGGFFTLLAQVEPGKIFMPLVVCRCAAFCTALLVLLISRKPIPSLLSNPLALLAGVLDMGGNLFYLLAKQQTRLDVAVVLASLYPAATVSLACILLKEKLSLNQWLGIGFCLLAIVLIVL